LALEELGAAVYESLLDACTRDLNAEESGSLR
jgi:hypothetical protein